MNETIQNHFKRFLEQLAPVSQEEFILTLSYFRELTLKKGEYLVREGKVCKQVGFIHQGLMRTFYFNEKGEDTTYCFCIENGFTTSFRSFLLQQPSTRSIQALEDARLLVIDYADLQTLYRISTIWQTIGRLLTEREFLAMEEYIAVLNGDTAREKYAWLLRE